MRKLLSPELIERALGYCMPMIKATTEHDLRGSDFHIVVLNPAVPYSDSNDAFLKAIMFQKSCGQEPIEVYKEIAQAKAKLSWEYRMSTRQLQAECSFLLKSGDTTYYGSVYNHGLVVAVSGLEAWQDEWLATVIMNTIIMLCQNTVGMAGRLDVDENGFII